MTTNNTNNTTDTTIITALADSYKFSHSSQYPEMKSMFDYMESRGGKYPETVFVGLQYYIKKYLSNPITQSDVNKAARMAKAHGVPFDKKGWDYIVQDLNGVLPVKIRAVREGSVIPVKNVLMTIESTDTEVPWIAGWLETLLMKVWYPTTIATKSYFVRKMLEKYGAPEWAQFAFHNFGDRGSSSVESAAIGGMAHLTQFMGTDNFNSLFMIEDFYNQSEESPAGYSVFATEHSTTTANADGSVKKEITFVERMLIENPDAPIMSFVADSYDVYNFTDKVTQPNSWIRETIENRPNQKFVIRPDSGEPLAVIGKMLDIMKENDIVFTRNEDGKIVFRDFGILWGDGITPDVIEEIIKMVMRKGFAAENMVFGSGGDIMQNINRDTQRFAIKCSSITRPNGTEQDVFKDPITDPGKTSKKGRITTYYNQESKTYFVDRVGKDFKSSVDVLETVFENGELYIDLSIDDIRKMSR